MKTPQQPDDPNPSIPLDRVSRFVRQLTHDVRNGLSAIDLEAAFIAELVSDPEASEEIRKLRGMVASNAKMLRELSQNFQPITLHEMPWMAATFFDELHARLAKQFSGENRLEVESRLGPEQAEIDLEQMVVAMTAIVTNAFQLRQDGEPLRLSGKIEEGNFVMELREPKTVLNGIPPEEWGLEPLNGSRPGGYGLGLYRARRIIEAHGGMVERRHEGGELITRVVLPLCNS